VYLPENQIWAVSTTGPNADMWLRHANFTQREAVQSLESVWCHGVWPGLGDLGHFRIYDTTSYGYVKATKTKRNLLVDDTRSG
jgi:hypothetical protein